MDGQGLPVSRVIDLMRQARRRDFTYQGGEILGSMCTAPDEAAAEAVALFLETNLGDPGHFPGTRSLEADVQRDLLSLAGADAVRAKNAQAVLTSGGTESNLLAVAAARAAWRTRTGRDGRPAVVVPETAHFSFEKARRLMDTRLVRVGVDEHQRADVDQVAHALDEDTCLVVGIAGTTETGALDPLDALARLAAQHGVPLHVDAALGGFLLPFLEEAGREPVPWDFSLPGVASITMDPHKMGCVPVAAGALLAREASFLEPIRVETPYVTSDSQAGLLGTRPGAAAAACWAAMRHLGREGYVRNARGCLDNADHFRARLRQHHLAFQGRDLNVVLVQTGDPVAVQQKLGARGWRVNAVERLGGVRIVVMPHVQRSHLDAFLPALVEAVAEHPFEKRQIPSGTVVA